MVLAEGLPLYARGRGAAQVLTCVIALAAIMAPAAGQLPTVQLEPVAPGAWSAPVAMAHAGDGSGRLFVAERAGMVQVVQGDAILADPLLDITGQVITGSERGLLGLAFHPDFGVPNAFGENKFYVYYSTPAAVGTTANHVAVISEFSVAEGNPNQADPGSERVLLTINEPQGNHNGGDIHFGPDGNLYIALGDGGGAGDDDDGHTLGQGNGQDPTNLLGSILRIDPQPENGLPYTIPADNPFVGNPDGWREEIYAWGLRNPFRFSFDDGPGGTGALLVGDVGQNAWEEVDIVTSGGNYGWRYYEGTHPFNADTELEVPLDELLDPIAEYAHAEFGPAVIGGYVYRGDAIPDLRGVYVFADLRAPDDSGGLLLAIDDIDPASLNDIVELTVEGDTLDGMAIWSLGEDEAGELYVLVQPLVSGEPAVYRIVPEPATAGLLLAGAVSLVRRRRR